MLLDGKLMGYVEDDMAKLVEEKLRVMKVKGLNKVTTVLSTSFRKTVIIWCFILYG